MFGLCPPLVSTCFDCSGTVPPLEDIASHTFAAAKNITSQPTSIARSSAFAPSNHIFMGYICKKLISLEATNLFIDCSQYLQKAILNGNFEIAVNGKSETTVRYSKSLKF